jgi:hypothetical protein
MKSLLALVFIFTAQITWAQDDEVMESGSVSSSADVNTSTPSSTSQTSVATTASRRSTFGVLFYTLGGYDDTQLKNADPSYSIYDSYISLSWKLPDDIRFSILPTFGYTTAGNDYLGREVTDKFYWRDSSVSVAQSHILEDYLPAAFDLKQKARIYLPTSDGSKEEGMIARLRLEVEGRYSFNRFSNVRAYMKPSYYFQRTTAYLDSSGRTKVSKLADSQHGAEVDWNLNKLFSVKPGFEIEEKWSNESEINDRDARRSSEISYRLGLEVRPIRSFNFTLGIQDKHDLTDPSLTSVVSYSLLTNLVVF